MRNRTVTITGVADTGAQSNLWGLREFLNCGYSTKDLMPVETQIRAANKNPINVLGAFKGLIKGKSPSGDVISSLSYVYISDSVSTFYMSYDTMVDLLMVDRYFPTIGGCTGPEVPATPVLHYVRSLNAGCANPPNDEVISCKCPQREATPMRPSELPYPAISENNERMKKWLMDRFASFTFNTCPHRPLPCMTGPPIEIHLDESATPKCCHTPAPVPRHW